MANEELKEGGPLLPDDLPEMPKAEDIMRYNHARRKNIISVVKKRINGVFCVVTTIEMIEPIEYLEGVKTQAQSALIDVNEKLSLEEEVSSSFFDKVGEAKGES